MSREKKNAGGELPAILRRPLAPEGDLAGDLVRGRPETRRLFPPEGGGDPAVLRSAASAPRAGQEPENADEIRVRLSPDVLRPSTPEAAAKLESVLRGEGALVSTGQQPLLFMGPLMVLYKALTAVARADALEREHGVPFLASFWVASDDHDWEEVGRVRLLDLGNEPREVTLRPPAERHRASAGETTLPETVERCLDDISELLPESEFVEEYLKLIRDAYRPGRTLGEAFGRALEGALEGQDFVWLDSASPQLRRSAAPLYRRVLEERTEVARAVESGTKRVREAGYEPQMAGDAGALPLFLAREGRRDRIRGDGERLTVGERRVEAADLLRALEEEPEAFTPNVALRPLVESWLLPVEETILGPSEIAYWAQLPDLFRWAGVRMPTVRPRLSWLVLEQKVSKVLEKLEVGPEAVSDGGRRLSRRVTEGERPEVMVTALERARSDIDRAMDRVEEASAESLPGIRSSVGAARHRLFEVLRELEDVMDHRIRERREVLLQQIRKAAAHLYPRGTPQERFMSPLYYLSRYGRAFLGEVRRRSGEVLSAPDGGGAMWEGDVAESGGDAAPPEDDVAGPVGGG